MSEDFTVPEGFALLAARLPCTGGFAGSKVRGLEMLGGVPVSFSCTSVGKVWFYEQNYCCRFSRAPGRKRVENGDKPLMG